MAVSISGSTLANYSEEEIENFLRGTSYSMANGTIQHDNVSGTRKRRWKIQWRALTSTQKESIVTQHINLLSGIGTGTFVDIHGASYTVTVPVNRPTLNVKTINSNPLRFDVAMTLEEV